MLTGPRSRETDGGVLFAVDGFPWSNRTHTVPIDDNCGAALAAMLDFRFFSYFASGEVSVEG